MPICLCIIYGCFSLHNSRIEQMQQRLYDLQSLKYLLSGALQKTFADRTVGNHFLQL